MYLKRKMICRVSIVYLAFLIFVPINLYAMEKENVDEKRVLIVNSYNSVNVWTNNFIKVFAERLAKISDEVVEIRIEYFNSLIHNENNYEESFRQMLNSKYKNYEADLIITIGPNALGAMQKEIVDKNSIFYQVPIVFRGITKSFIFNEQAEKYITGDSYDVNMTRIINLIMDLNKGIHKIKMVSLESDLEELPISKKNQQLMKQYYAEQVQLEYINKNQIEDILEELRKEEDSNYAIVIGSNYYSNELKRLVSSEETIQKIREVSDVPIYTCDETYVMAGAIGGTVWPAEKGGIKLAEDVKTILFDKEFPELQSVSGEYMFNYKEIYRNDIIIPQIPRNSTIVNKKRFQLLLPKSIKILIEFIIRVVVIVGGGVLFGIYKQRQIAKRNKELYEQAKMQEQIRTDFITGLSHDLKTPINIIRSSVQLMTSLNEEIEQEYLFKRMKVINQNANRLLRLVNNIMDVIKLEESSYYKVKLQNVNLVEVVEDICLGTVDYMKQRELEFTFDTEEEEIITAIDKEKIERVVLNLLSNAIKFTPNQGKIYVYMERVHEHARIIIKDSGVGIEKEKLDAIFLKFYQVDTTVTKSSEGSGIGLYIVKKLVELHEGEISVESKVGEGTSFVILLPIKELKETQSADFEIRRGVEQVIQIELADL